MELLIYDSNAHPTLSGGWPTKSRDANFETLAKQIEDEYILGASAVGLWAVESYEHRAFAQTCKQYEKIVPVAGFAPNMGTSIKDELTELKALGFKGIKIHPCSCHSDLVADRDRYIETFVHAEELGLIPGDRIAAVKATRPDGKTDWIYPDSLSELIAIVRGPDFIRDGENIWILREDSSFRGSLLLEGA